MAVLDKLLSRLHRVFDKDPQKTPVILLSCTVDGVQVSTSNMRITGTGGLNIDFSEMTLQELVTSINAVAGYSASLVANDYMGLLARAILEDGAHSAVQNTSLHYPTSLLWAEMQTCGWILDEQVERLRQLGKQLYFHSADSDWLDYWSKTYFGINRNHQESDDDYVRRAIHDIVALNQNNIALGNLIRETVTGYDCDVIDTPSETDALSYGGLITADGAQLYNGSLTAQYGMFSVAAQIEMEDQVPLAELSQKVREIVNRHKAAGTELRALDFKMETSDSLTMAEHADVKLEQFASDTLPWGMRYDGTILHDNADYRLFNGALTYSGADGYDGYAAVRTKYNTAWEADAKAAHLKATDQQTALMCYDGLADFDGFVDFGAIGAPVRDGRAAITVKRHYLYNGRRTYGGGKVYAGSLRYNGATGYAADMLHQGIHIIQEARI